MNVLKTRQPRRACRTQNRTRGEIPYQLGLSGAGLLHWQQKPPHDIVHILIHMAKANSSRLLLNVLYSVDGLTPVAASSWDNDVATYPGSQNKSRAARKTRS